MDPRLFYGGEKDVFTAVWVPLYCLHIHIAFSSLGKKWEEYATHAEPFPFKLLIFYLISLYKNTSGQLQCNVSYLMLDSANFFLDLILYGTLQGCRNDPLGSQKRLEMRIKNVTESFHSQAWKFFFCSVCDTHITMPNVPVYPAVPLFHANSERLMDNETIIRILEKAPRSVKWDFPSNNPICVPLL